MADTDLLNPRAVPGDNKPPPETVEDEVGEALAPLNDRIATLRTRIGALPVISDDAARAKAIEVGTTARALVNDVEADFTRVKAPYLKASQIVDTAFRGPKAQAKALIDDLAKRIGIYDRAKADRIRREADEAARKAREEEQRRFEAQRAAEAAGRVAHAAQHQARADAAAEAAERAEAVSRQSLQDLTRAKTASGATVSSTTVWRGEIVDAAALDRDALWPLIPLEAKQKALDAWVKTNTTKSTTAAPTLAGTRVFTDVRTRI